MWSVFYMTIDYIYNIRLFFSNSYALMYGILNNINNTDTSKCTQINLNIIYAFIYAL